MTPEAFYDSDPDLKPYVVHGDFVFAAVSPLSYCPTTHKQLFAIPGGGRATERQIVESMPRSLSQLSQKQR